MLASAEVGTNPPASQELQLADVCGSNLTLTREHTMTFEFLIHRLSQARTPLRALEGTALSLVQPHKCDAIYAPSLSNNVTLWRILHSKTDDASACLLRRQALRFVEKSAERAWGASDAAACCTAKMLTCCAPKTMRGVRREDEQWGSCT